jgi:mannosyltransferase
MSSKTDSTGSVSALVLAVILAVAIALRFIALDHGLWYDEIVTLVEAARMPFRHIVTEFQGINSHPLYSLLAHASLVTFGESAWALRLPSAVFGVASVAMVFVFARSFLTRAESWVATAVIAASYHHVWFSQNARGYTLMGFLTLVSTHFLMKATARGRIGDYAVYVIASVAGVYTHLTMAFVIAGHAVAILGGRLVGWRPAAKVPVGGVTLAWMASGLISLIAYLPFIPGIVELMQRPDTKQAAEVATAGWALNEAIRNLLLGTGVLAALVGGAFAAVGALSLLRRQSLILAVLIVPAAVTGITLLVLGQPIRPRFFFFLSAAAAVFVGRGIGAIVDLLAPRNLGPRRVELAVLIIGSGLVSLSAVALPTAYRVPKQDFHNAVPRLVEEERAGATIVMAGPMCLPVQTYYLKQWTCLETVDDWRRAQELGKRVLVAWTLGDYIENPQLRREVREHCPVVARFPGTLGGGDITICEMPRP